MAKKNAVAMTNQYANKQEEIRKAKGNPNKNVHAKKNGSNYQGYTAGHYMADKITQKVAKQERVVLPTGLKLALGIDLAVLVAALILRLTIWKENELMSYITTVLLGITCAGLFYIRKNYHNDKKGLYTVIQILLCVFGVLYAVMGVMGLLNYFGIIG